MINIKIPEFDYDFFDPAKPNPVLSSIVYLQCEIDPMLENYFYQHRVKHPVVQPIILLLRELNQYLLVLDARFRDDLTLKDYIRVDEALLKEILQLQQESHSGKYDYKERDFLDAALYYAIKSVSNSVMRFKASDAVKAKEFLAHSNLLDYVKIK